MRRSEQMQLRIARYWRILKTFWWIPTLTLGIGLAVQGWKSITQPLVYESFARILVSGRITLPQSTIYNEEALNFFGTQIELMKSPEVHKRAAARVQAARPDLLPCPVSLDVNQIPRTSIFVLRASGTSTEYIKAYLNAILDEYILLRKNILEEKSQSALTAITLELSRVERDLRRSEQEIVDWKSANNLIFLKEASDGAGAQLAKLNADLAKLEAEFNLMGLLSDEQNFGRVAAEALENPSGSLRPGEQEGRGDFLLSGELAGPAQNYFSARQKLALLEQERAELLVVRQEVHPRVVAVDDAIRATKQLIELFKDQSHEQLESRKQALAAQISNTREQIAKWEERAVTMSRQMAEFEQMQEKLNREKALYDQLISSIQRVDVNSNIQQDILSVMEYATTPNFRLQPIARDLLVGALTGLACGIAILLIIAAFDDRVVSATEIQSMLGQEVVGIIPQVPQGQQLLRLSEDDNPGLLEATRKVRSWLLFSKWENGPPKSIMIASAIPREGKSTTAYNLALCLSTSGKKVLLVDADLRRGQLHGFLEIDQSPGIGNILNGECSVDKAIVQTRFANVSAIPRGYYEVRGTEVFLETSLDHILAELEKPFDFVIFDTAPSLATDESSVLAGRMDAVLMVIRASYTSLRIAMRLQKHLIERGASLEGIVYNGVNPSSHEYPYYHYYYHYDGEGKPNQRLKDETEKQTV